MVAYLDDTNALEVYDGAAWGAVTPDVASATPSDEGVVYGLTGGQTTLISPGVTGPDTKNNVALGFGAGGTAIATASGFGNVIIGPRSAQNITTGHTNILVGPFSNINLTTGIRNVLIGAAPSFATASDNTFIGNSSGFSAGATAGQNTFLGYKAGDQGITEIDGSNLTLLGHLANPSTGAVSNQITLGNSSITSLRCQVTTISALSDIRDKTNVQDSTYGLELVNQLRPVTFDWNMRDGAKVGVPDLGFIAQELAAVEDNYDPERLALTLRDNPDKLEATPGRLIPILVKAIQELSARVEELENER
jgi:hypothetical protein